MTAARPGTTTGRTRRIGAGTWWEGRSGLVLAGLVAAFSTYLLIGLLTMDVSPDVDPPGPRFFPAIITVIGYLLAIGLAIAYIRHPEPAGGEDPAPEAPTGSPDTAPAGPADASGTAAPTGTGGTPAQAGTSGPVDPAPVPAHAGHHDAGDDAAFSSPFASAVAASRMHPDESNDSEEDRRAIAEARAADAQHRTHSDFVALAWAVGGFAAFAALIVPLGWILAAAILFWCIARAMGSRRALFDATLALTFSSLVYLAFDVALGLNLPSGILGGGL